VKKYEFKPTKIGRWSMKGMIKMFSVGVILLGTVSLAMSDEPEQSLRKIVVFDQTIVHEPAQIAKVRKSGGTVIKPLHIINGMAVYLPPEAAEAVLKEPGVLRIDDDVIVNAVGKPPAPQPTEALPWGVDRINADSAWATTKGLAVKVGIVDTGIDLAHPDLMANIKGNVNTINPLKSGNDDNGHGTHVAGTVAAADNAIGVIGAGPEIYLYAVKVLGKSGSGWLSDIIEGLQWCINNGMQVANMSLGTYSDVQSFHDAIMAAYNSGIVVIAAAGNDGVSTPLYPAAYDETIAVAASDINNQIPAWSNYGPHVDLTGPGADIYSTYKGSTYKTLSGTSMATPHVAGTSALILTTIIGLYDSNANDVWDPIEVKSKLQDTSEDLGYASYQQGAGLVRADLAVQ
jgi:subtilisin family serine protease